MELHILVTFAVVVFSAASATDYCNTKLCGPHKTHVGCKKSKNLSPKCGKGSYLVPLSSDDKKLILEQHNFYRNLTAGGGLSSNLPKAIRMSTMKWDDELEELARYKSSECTFSHDECRNTDAFWYAGQNLYLSMGTTLRQKSTSQLIKDPLKMWFNEYKDVEPSAIDHYQRPQDSSTQIGHFTVMVNDLAHRVGCSGVIYAHPKYKHAFLFVCNYARTNILGMPVYKSGAVAASACRHKTNPIYTALCADTEPVNPNGF